MPIPGNLITADIQGESCYQEYLAKVAKHQRYLASETGSDHDSPTPKPTKSTKNSKPSAPKAALRPPVTKPASSQQTEPQPIPAKSQGKKRKLVIEISDKPSPARKSNPSLVTKQRKPTSSLRSVDESVAEGIPKKESRVDDEEADVQRTMEETLKSRYDVPRGPLSPVVIREPESKKYQPLPEKIPADQYIFQRCTSTPTGSSCHNESSSLYAELGLMDSEAGPNPDEQAEGQAGPNPGDAAASRPLQSPVVHAGPNLERMEFEVILEEPASSTGTLSSLQHLTKDLSLGNLFFNDKTSEADNEKTTAETVDLTLRPESPNVHRPLKATANETTTTTTIHPPPSQSQQSTIDSIKKKKRRDSPKTPPGSPPHQPPLPSPLAGPSGASRSPGASGSLQVPPPPPPPPPSPSTKQEECHKLPTDSVDDSILRRNVSKPLPMGGLPSQVTIQSDFFFNKDLEYLRYGSKGSRPALSILKMMAAYYPDVGLEQMVPDQMWIEKECKYDIAAIAVRTHMRILSVVRIEVFSMYGYGVLMIMRFNEIHKFSDGTLHQINEALDYRVKEFK
nr:hypothetical protein [Tanacetum cinerariifolium]